MTAAIGVAVGLGIVGVAVIGTLATVLVLVLEHFIDSRRNTQNRS